MSLAKKYGNRLRTQLRFRAVWPPGTNIQVGDVLTFQDDFFHPVANLNDFGVGYQSEEALRFGGLRLNALGVRNTIFQGGAEVSLSQLDLNAEAELKISFSEQDGYFLRTPDLIGTQTENLLGLAQKVVAIPNWKFGKYFIAHTIYRAEEFVFLASKAKRRTVKFGGAGKAIVSFLTLGLSTQLEKTSAQSLSIEIFGQGGPVAMGVVRVKKNGELDFR